MPGEIDEAQVQHIARLARLNLTPDEVRLFARQLADILDYFQQLNSADTAGVEPLTYPLPLTNVLAADEPAEPFEPRRALANAPQREGHFFKVPPVLDQDSGA